MEQIRVVFLVVVLVSVFIIVSGCASSSKSKRSVLPEGFQIFDAHRVADSMLDAQGDEPEDSVYRFEAGMALVSGVIQRNLDSSPNRRTPSVGSIRTPQGGAWMVSSLPNYQRFWQLAEACNQSALMEMLNSGDVMYVRGDMKILRAVNDRYEVQLTDGPHYGYTGWVNEMALYQKPSEVRIDVEVRENPYTGYLRRSRVR